MPDDNAAARARKRGFRPAARPGPRRGFCSAAPTRADTIPAMRALSTLLLLLCGGCQFLQNEFATLDRAPPSATAPAPQTLPW